MMIPVWFGVLLCVLLGNAQTFVPKIEVETIEDCEFRSATDACIELVQTRDHIRRARKDLGQKLAPIRQAFGTAETFASEMRSLSRDAEYLVKLAKPLKFVPWGIGKFFNEVIITKFDTFVVKNLKKSEKTLDKVEPSLEQASEKLSSLDRAFYKGDDALGKLLSFQGTMEDLSEALETMEDYCLDGGAIEQSLKDLQKQREAFDEEVTKRLSQLALPNVDGYLGDWQNAVKVLQGFRKVVRSFKTFFDEKVYSKVNNLLNQRIDIYFVVDLLVTDVVFDASFTIRDVVELLLTPLRAMEEILGPLYSLLDDFVSSIISPFVKRVADEIRKLLNIPNLGMSEFTINHDGLDALGNPLNVIAEFINDKVLELEKVPQVIIDANLPEMVTRCNEFEGDAKVDCLTSNITGQIPELDLPNINSGALTALVKNDELMSDLKNGLKCVAHVEVSPLDFVPKDRLKPNCVPAPEATIKICAKLDRVYDNQEVTTRFNNAFSQLELAVKEERRQLRSLVSKVDMEIEMSLEKKHGASLNVALAYETGNVETYMRKFVGMELFDLGRKSAVFSFGDNKNLVTIRHGITFMRTSFTVLPWYEARWDKDATNAERLLAGQSALSRFGQGYGFPASLGPAVIELKQKFKDADKSDVRIATVNPFTTVKRVKTLWDIRKNAGAWRISGGTLKKKAILRNFDPSSRVSVNLIVPLPESEKGYDSAWKAIDHDFHDKYVQRLVEFFSVPLRNMYMFYGSGFSILYWKYLPEDVGLDIRAWSSSIGKKDPSTSTDYKNDQLMVQFHIGRFVASDIYGVIKGLFTKRDPKPGANPGVIGQVRPADIVCNSFASSLPIVIPTGDLGRGEECSEPGATGECKTRLKCALENSGDTQAKCLPLSHRINFVCGDDIEDRCYAPAPQFADDNSFALKAREFADLKARSSRGGCEVDCGRDSTNLRWYFLEKGEACFPQDAREQDLKPDALKAWENIISTRWSPTLKEPVAQLVCRPGLACRDYICQEPVKGDICRPTDNVLASWKRPFLVSALIYEQLAAEEFTEFKDLIAESEGSFAKLYRTVPGGCGDNLSCGVWGAGCRVPQVGDRCSTTKGEVVQMPPGLWYETVPYVLPSNCGDGLECRQDANSSINVCQEVTPSKPIEVDCAPEQGSLQNVWRLLINGQCRVLCDSSEDCGSWGKCYQVYTHNGNRAHSRGYCRAYYELDECTDTCGNDHGLHCISGKCKANYELDDPCNENKGCPGSKFACDKVTKKCRPTEVGDSCDRDAGKRCGNRDLLCDGGICRAFQLGDTCLNDGMPPCGDHPTFKLKCLEGICFPPESGTSCSTNGDCGAFMNCGDDGECRYDAIGDSCVEPNTKCKHDLGKPEVLICGKDKVCKILTKGDSCHNGACFSPELTCKNDVCSEFVEGTVCSVDFGCGATTGLECDRDTELCVPKSVDSPCTEESCGRGLICGDDQVCREHKAGDSCADFEYCGSKAICDADTKLCRPFQLGDTCSLDSSCQANNAATEMACVAGTCQAKSSATTLGSPCDPQAEPEQIGGCGLKLICSDDRACREFIEGDNCSITCGSTVELACIEGICS
mmetsp:Transcript_13484/g.24145  ORF Transcript_13484/g.24145 Transcript_13484/m.24145 type:complete len:1581 (-) Transcript_13484:92-4834(-)|eukprot:CAMPEP_0203761352 /NCGR_PEP_ID=MMETSP0098-20131031/14461_1 /ASSEMBLY_ACC=CAM_ASM_000208 /TAXON_ID=96639 /ORGANISM=" , Strain NY0313808BC1" /LENGTH=1580 /DNA_ID=CAMNT_0050655313 /DNA_START=626 /DNA_END=5368 /DNA_ORIENTATION=+